MSGFEMASAVVAVAGVVVAVAGMAGHIRALQRRPFRADVAPAKGSAARGITYAFTEGMAPWAKESTRRHLAAYLRGIGFHAGVFAALTLLPVSPWLPAAPGGTRLVLTVALGTAAVAALAGFGIRLREPGLRRLSTADDYASLALVTLFLLSATAAAARPSLLPAYWVSSGVLLAYAPFGKIRHSVYFFYTRTFFGLLFGRRGVLAIAR